MRFLRASATGFGAAALALVALASFSSAQTIRPRSAPTPRLTPGPAVTAFIPTAPPTLPPANSPTTMPYPAYGSPAPGATASAAAAGVPQIVDLNQAIAIGFAKSPALASARGTVYVDAAPVTASRLAFLPAVSGSASTTHENFQAAGGATGGSTAALGHVVDNGLSFSLRQLIYDGGNLLAQLRSAQASENAAIELYRREAQTVANNVAQAYYSALAAQRTTAAAVESLRNAEAQVALVQAQVRAGTAAASAVAPLAFQAAEARSTLVTDQGNELIADANFANALGLDPNVNVAPRDDVPANPTSGTISSLPIPSYGQAIARALALRPDFAQAQQTLLASQYTLKSAELGYFPSLSGSGSWGTASTDPTGGTFRNTDSVGVTLTIPIPFLDQGVTEGKILQAKGNIQIAQANLDSTRLTIELNVKSALVALISAKAKIDQVDAEYTNAVTTLQSTQAQYKVGVAAITDLINAQNQYTTALVDQVNAIYSLREAEQSYLFATGEIANVMGP